MTSNEPHERSEWPQAGDDEIVPMPRFPAGPPSIISSRMTDIASEDGDGHAAEQMRVGSSLNRRSGIASESRPDTARTGNSRNGWSQSGPHRLGYQRGSISNSVTGSGASARPMSSASRSHVSSLTSHAFFHPMSSSRLQAQRGASRPSTTTNQQPRLTNNETAAENRISVVQHHDVTANPARLSQLSHQITNDEEGHHQAPPSRGTDATEGETYDRVTANTSPTHDHYPAASLSESAENMVLSLDVDKSQGYKNGANLPTPGKSPRSFRSGFMLPNKGDNASVPQNRSMPGAEKLSSGASSPQLTPLPAAERPAKPSTKERHPKLGRNHEYFEGNTVFAMGGRLQNTHHRPINIATGSLVVIPAVLFFIFSAPWLWNNVSPAVPLVFAYIFYISMSSFIHASASDPGILPRNLHKFPPPEDDEDPLRLAPPMNDWTLIKSAESSTAAMEVPTKYCKTCNIWRPPRAHHCRLCDNCVETQDHHCVWLNNCVGRRNYRYFFTFVTATTLLGLYLIGASLAHVLVYASQEKVSVGTAIDDFRVPFAMFIYGIIATLYPAALMGYHLFLMARGETTREFLNSHKFLKKDRYRAFTQGSAWKNWAVVLCRPRPPTYYRFKNLFEEGDQRLGERKTRDNTNVRTHGQDMEMQNVKPPSSSGFQGPTSLRGHAEQS
ncbi:palmitoyltransferase ERF2 [Apiospora saccharicola]|uniref:Palmitoyltransferase n=1 Tax=Apiospora saccharicola TaxID=335842 RepID=A0ABR1V9M7_9PEZI